MHEFERLKIFNEYELKHEKITNCKKLGINYSEALLCHKLPANTNHEQGKVHIIIFKENTFSWQVFQ